MEEKKTQGFGWWDVAVYVSSVIAVVTFMCHFWWSPLGTVSLALWAIAGAFAIFSVYGGIIERSQIQEAGMKKGRVTAAAVIGCLVLLGLALSATMFMAPLRLAYSGQLG
ncbi:MAG: hypothetical protein WBC55_09340 [Dehalococcoidia bacterium]